MQGSSGFPWKTVIIGLLVAGMVFCCALVFGGGAAYFLSKSDSDLSNIITIDLGNKPEEEAVEPTLAAPEVVSPEVMESTEEEEVQVEPVIPPTEPAAIESSEAPQPEPVEEEPPTEIPAVEEPAQAENPPTESSDGAKPLTGKQERSESRIFDDFSSNALDWYQAENDSESVLIKNGVYTLQTRNAENPVWSEFPVDFIPYEIAFDVKGPSGVQDGTFGVECHYKDNDNLYYVEFNLGTREYTIAEINNGVQMALTKVNSVGQYWQPTPSMKSPPTAVNHIAISCYLENITVFVNDKLVDQVDVKKPLPETGYGTFYVNYYPNADENGYSVSFDNVDVFQPRQ